MKDFAICVKCGAKKKKPWSKCRSCSFQPAEKSDGFIKSIYLSTARPSTTKNQKQLSEELEVIGSKLKAGQEVEIPAKELASLAAQARQFQAVSSLAVWGAVFRFFLPAILFIASIFIALHFLKE